jgi:hypothetical protein
MFGLRRLLLDLLLHGAFSLASMACATLPRNG